MVTDALHWTVAEVAIYWRIPERTIYHAISKGALPAVRVGGLLRIRREEALAYGKDISFSDSPAQPLQSAQL